MTELHPPGAASSAIAFSQTATLSQPLSYDIRHIPIKRAFDVLFSLCALVLGLPLFLVVMLAIRFTSKGKVIYAHERIGRGGKAFKCYKFRTMYRDADQRLKSILETNSDMRQEWEASRKLKNDPRVIPLGRFLRKTSLDELPQFWNILKGDMSIVGPRPVVKAEVINYYGPKASKILSVRPGLTCLWQVSGRSDTSYSRRIMLDEKYVDSQSFVLDMKLILNTIPCIVKSKGAY
jgi:undecaprenyl-phosphate galactose phosphotransferase